jgi:NADPH:quinone reductase-like Zn-dependent oxidoreductase
VLRARVYSRVVDQTLVKFWANICKDDMLVLKQLVDAGKVTPEIDRTYSLSEAAAAFAYVEAGHTRGKVVITMKTAGVSPQAVWSVLWITNSCQS